MVELVRDVRLIRILRWRSMVQNFSIIGAIFLAAGLYRLAEDDWIFSRLTAIYLPVGITLWAGALWLLVRGPIIYVDKDGVTENDV
ncbi:hypothetical protein [Paracoccus tibetensis]|uniref:Uncharacterized protein n=1 Tax=Paracoccus tibetensis TaxID=336292 RepID=A0A1G5K699_9RHOB|nr:hypothetical protein [Paracoccus tibetensis]SCY96057.1 hypothetical protein SAMN05660710_03713 [Paracoccus tibetensis]